MEKHLELLLGLSLAGATAALTFYSAILAAIIGTVAAAVWSLKLRKAWQHRND